MRHTAFLRLGPVGAAAVVLQSSCTVDEQTDRPAGGGTLVAAGALAGADDLFSVVEATIDDMRQALAEQRTTSRDLVQQYLTRIALYEDRLNAVISVNPNALAIADSLDGERARGRIRGPLHGIPIALKDNIHAEGMPTTGGALAFADLVPPYEATLTTNLRAAGAIILAKTQLTELANWVAYGMPENYNALTGYGMNPWDPRRDPRQHRFDGRAALSPGGSSSGVGTNVSFWAGNVGTETSGSILWPSQANFLVGIKPTVGRVSRYGVIPITADQDTPGPMTRTVADAAILLGAMEGRRPDPNDSATTGCPPPAGRDYTRFLNPRGLEGARIGIPRAFFYEATLVAGGNWRGGLNDAQRKAMDDAIAVLKRLGAVIVDPANIPSVVDPNPTENFLNWGLCRGFDHVKGQDGDCSIAWKYGMKRDFTAWLESLGDEAPVKTLTELRQWNIVHQRAGAIRYGQSNLDVSDEMDVHADRARYEADRRKDIRLSATNGIDAVLQRHTLDALLLPGGLESANIGARAGYPTVTVPFAFLPVPRGQGPNAFPAGFNPKPAPYNVSFTGTACSEGRLIELAYAFEQATKKRVRPPLFP